MFLGPQLSTLPPPHQCPNLTSVAYVQSFLHGAGAYQTDWQTDTTLRDHRSQQAVSAAFDATSNGREAARAQGTPAFQCLVYPLLGASAGTRHCGRSSTEYSQLVLETTNFLLSLPHLLPERLNLIQLAKIFLE